MNAKKKLWISLAQIDGISGSKVSDITSAIEDLIREVAHDGGRLEAIETGKKQFESLFGKKAVIIANTSNHHFEIGQTIILHDPDLFDWEDAKILGQSNGDFWEVDLEDFELVDNEQQAEYAE